MTERSRERSEDQMLMELPQCPMVLLLSELQQINPPPKHQPKQEGFLKTLKCCPFPQRGSPPWKYRLLGVSVFM